MRVGIHAGRPRKLGGDYLGRDVNIAARVVEAAKPDEILVSDVTCTRLAGSEFELGRGKRLKASGAPEDLRVHAVS
jgi:adenylate cyclase